MEFGLELETGERLGAWVVRGRGELDLSTSGDLASAMAARPEGRALVVDLREIGFMDSTGVRALIRAVRDTRSAGCAAALIVGPGPVARLLEVAHVDTLLPRIPDDRDETLASLSAGPV
jgi:anti-anti-sigma factor